MEINENLSRAVCLVCGGKVQRRGNSKAYRCQECGENYDLDEYDYPEIDLTTFDKLLLHSLKRKPKVWAARGIK